MAERLLDIQNLSIGYKTYRGVAKVVNKINLHVNKGEKIGLVGESGCGKTTTMKTILRTILPDIVEIPPEGKIIFNGQSVLKLNQRELYTFRRTGVSMISQSPMSALNPVFTIGQQLTDIIKYSEFYKNPTKKECNEIAINALKSVMLSDPKRLMNSYPYQLSGGMRQRVCIASALVMPKELLIADEPCTALDVTIQDQIHSLLRELVEEKKRSLIMITHSLGVARDLVDRIYIMYGGEIVETCEIDDIFDNPCHPYTQGLLKCVPRLSGGGLTPGIYGYVPDYVKPPKGCRFSPRCPYAIEQCKKEKPNEIKISPGHFVSCLLYQNGTSKLKGDN